MIASEEVFNKNKEEILDQYQATDKEEELGKISHIDDNNKLGILPKSDDFIKVKSKIGNLNNCEESKQNEEFNINKSSELNKNEVSHLQSEIQTLALSENSSQNQSNIPKLDVKRVKSEFKQNELASMILKQKNLRELYVGVVLGDITGQSTDYVGSYKKRDVK